MISKLKQRIIDLYKYITANNVEKYIIRNNIKFDYIKINDDTKEICLIDFKNKTFNKIYFGVWGLSVIGKFSVRTEDGILHSEISSDSECCFSNKTFKEVKEKYSYLPRIKHFK